MGAALTARIWFVALRFVVLRRNVFIRWGICLRGLVPLLRSSIYFCLKCTQGFISGFALIPPWAMQECRAYGTRCR